MKVMASSDKPRIAKCADRICSEMESFFEILKYEDNIENVLSEEDQDIIDKAYDIFMFVDREFTEVYREQRRRGER